MRIKEIINENIGAIKRIDITDNAIFSGIAATLLRKLAPKAALYKFYVALYPGSWQDNSQYTISLETGSYDSPIPGLQLPVGNIDSSGNVNINKDIKTYVGDEVINLDSIQRQIITRAAQKLSAPSISEPTKQVSEPVKQIGPPRGRPRKERPPEPKIKVKGKPRGRSFAKSTNKHSPDSPTPQSFRNRDSNS